MKDARIATVVRTVEARYPGTRGVVEPYRTHDGDPTIRWWIRFLHVRERDLGFLSRFALRVAYDLYGVAAAPFLVSAYGARNSAAYLARRRAEAAEENRRRRRRGRRRSVPVRSAPASAARRS